MSHLLNTLTVKNHVFHNRLIYPPICIGKAEEDGAVSDTVISYYDSLSKGGNFSIIVVPDSFVTQNGRTSLGQLSSASDDMIVGLTTLAKTIKSNGSKALLQLNHAGSCTFENIIGSTPVAPSQVNHPRKGDFPRSLELYEIESIINSFRAAAIRGKQAGFDGVEIHSAHGYLLSQFYSPLTNQRDDEYGGSLFNRTRLHTEIISAIKDFVDDDFLITLRLGALDYMEGGSTMEDAVEAARVFQDAGVDMLSISGGMCGYINPLDDGPGYFSKESKAIKSSVNIPIILTGGIKNLKDAEKLLEYETCDMIGVGRTALDDFDWARRAIAALKR